MLYLTSYRGNLILLEKFFYKTARMSNSGSASMWKERPNEKSDGAVEFASQSMANLHPFMDSSLINRIDEGGSRLSRIIRPMSQLQDIATELKLEGCDLELPQIVVIGSQVNSRTFLY